MKNILVPFNAICHWLDPQIFLLMNTSSASCLNSIISVICLLNDSFCIHFWIRYLRRSYCVLSPDLGIYTCNLPCTNPSHKILDWVWFPSVLQKGHVNVTFPGISLLFIFLSYCLNHGDNLIYQIKLSWFSS